MLVHTPTHSWLKQLNIAYVLGPSRGVADRVASELMGYFHHAGHITESTPAPETDVLLTTAKLGEPLGWRESLMFTARRRYKLKHVPTVFTIVHAFPEQFHEWMTNVKQILESGSDRTPGRYLAGIPETASETLYRQGKRGARQGQ
jgi:hypothetical protein